MPRAVPVIAALILAAAASAQSGPLVPEGFVLAEEAQAAIEAQWLTEEERAALRVFHGVWDETDLENPQLAAMVALNAWRFEDEVLADETIRAEVRAAAQSLAGEYELALETLDGARSNHADRLRAEALEALGDDDAANAAVDGAVRRLLGRTIEDAGELTEGVRALFVRSRVLGQPAHDYQTMMQLLSRAHQELDRLYWPAKLAEAELLLDKDNTREAVDALHETLELNPRCAQAWYELGRVALNTFDFGGAEVAATALRRVDPQHPLADLLMAESRLIQDDPEGAVDFLEPLMKRLPKQRRALALDAAAEAILYDEVALTKALAAYDALSPGSAEAYYVVGEQLSFNRQYAPAAEMLEEAIRRKPNWPAPQIELGLLELQSGRDDRALAALKSVAELDQFNKRAANSLFLLEELAEYRTEESEHFIVRYKPGIDRVLAHMMLEPLEEMHAIVSERFQFEPDRKTIIELMPDHQRFAVRITGIPAIHTIAACTGPVIAMEVPREGPRTRHLGPFDWVRVVRHEYTHTITLAQTQNRIPHWLTEAAAVSMELAPRDYTTCIMLARAHRNGTLFSLEDIKWGFVRPKQPDDRSKAYAQGHWMLEYMNETFGESAVVRLLAHYFDGEREDIAMPKALGVPRDEFFRGFHAWAGEQVESWGMAAEPSLIELQDEARWADPDMAMVMAASQQARLDVIAKTLTGRIGLPKTPRSTEAFTGDMWPPLMRPPLEITDEMLAAWLVDHPDHPDLMEMHLRRAIGPRPELSDELVADLERYIDLRPVDPFPHKQLAFHWLKSDTPDRAVPHLEALDIREQKTPAYALELARLYRARGDLDTAMAKVTRALHINPYDAPNRELAATIALERRDFESARLHIESLTLIEPDRDRHQQRLEAVKRMLDG